jgi:hypothetical protein
LALALLSLGGITRAEFMTPQDPDQKLCDNCHERPATCHICHGDSAHEGKSLCRECFESANLAVVSGMTKAWEAGCRYCGGEPYSGGGHSLDGLSGTMKMSFKCKSCTEEYFRFLRQKLPGFGNPDITTGQAAEMRKRDMAGVFIEVEEHMKKWVADRDSQ